MSEPPTDPEPGAARLYSGQSPDERNAHRRRRLLDAGRELFGTTGYAGTSVERLCSQAKVSTRHFYQLYGNKEAAFLDVYDEINGQSLERALTEMAASEGEPMDVRVSQALLAYIAPLAEDLRAARIAFVEVMGISPETEQRRLAYRESLVALVEAEGAAAVARGEVTPRDFRFATLALDGAASAVIYDWASAGGTDDVRALEQAVIDLALTILVR
jgi:AcrR family transcriptional regulator